MIMKQLILFLSIFAFSLSASAQVGGETANSSGVAEESVENRPDVLPQYPSGEPSRRPSSISKWHERPGLVSFP